MSHTHNMAFQCPPQRIEAVLQQERNIPDGYEDYEMTETEDQEAQDSDGAGKGSQEHAAAEPTPEAQDCDTEMDEVPPTSSPGQTSSYQYEGGVDPLVMRAFVSSAEVRRFDLCKHNTRGGRGGSFVLRTPMKYLTLKTYGVPDQLKSDYLDIPYNDWPHPLYNAYCSGNQRLAKLSKKFFCGVLRSSHISLSLTSSMASQTADSVLKEWLPLLRDLHSDPQTYVYLCMGKWERLHHLMSLNSATTYKEIIVTHPNFSHLIEFLQRLTGNAGASKPLIQHLWEPHPNPKWAAEGVGRAPTWLEVYQMILKGVICGRVMQLVDQAPWTRALAFVAETALMLATWLMMDERCLNQLRSVPRGDAPGWFVERQYPGDKHFAGAVWVNSLLLLQHFDFMVVSPSGRGRDADLSTFPPLSHIDLPASLAAGRVVYN